MGFIPGPTDPFYELMQPPADETPAQATARQKRELDAQRVNDRIDDMLKEERAQAKKSGRSVVKVLLLGQSESGKSTTLKNFRMRFAKEEWEQERDGWRSVVQLNVVRSITTIVRVVQAEINGDTHADDSDDQESVITVESNQSETLKFTEKHQLLMIRLAPLVSVEAELKRRLGAGAEPPQLTSMVATPFDTPHENPGRRRPAEFSVRSWKDVIEQEQRSTLLSDGSTACDTDSTTTVMAGCKDDMKALWQDKAVQQALKRRKLVLPDSAGFFLNDLDRIATRDYVVTDNDIVRARLRTVGIQEYRLSFKNGPWDHTKSGKASGWEWRIFDVGGCRTLRSAWLPYFEAVNVIIFLSPVSVFDQRLDEDRRVNRLEDSILLWTAICSSRLLAKTQLILFLNKCDLLRRKLKRGVKVTQYLPSYGDKPNDVMSVVKYFREKFRDIQKQHSPEHRSVYIYPTTVTDTEATGLTLESVRDGVLRENLAASQLI
ncbi:heterotrimeric G protein alpha subunit [Coprinellus micaceus]|uniref:Heterotrimeric G protein alpha subunit n=1 Tax=Coprinellus micaceus TaxID=71717 RepID=A0A4Y7SV30_COPMI|nr:heterotrimeric G protein alpha subunit [Coprinellus micaceus]